MSMRPPRITGISNSEIMTYLKTDGFNCISIEGHHHLLQRFFRGKILTVTAPGSFFVTWRGEGQRNIFHSPCHHIMEQIGVRMRYSDVTCVVFKIEHTSKRRFNHHVIVAFTQNYWICINPYWFGGKNEERAIMKFCLNFLWIYKIHFGLRNVKFLLYKYATMLR